MEEQNTADKDPEKGQLINTVLVVDDDDAWCFISKKILQKNGVGNQIITATNGRDAIKELQAISANGDKLPELIFLDIKMPVMDGFEFLDKLIKSTELDLSGTKIYMCSSSFHPKDKEKANLYPVAGFLNKPLTREMLRDIIR